MRCLLSNAKPFIVKNRLWIDKVWIMSNIIKKIKEKWTFEKEKICPARFGTYYSKEARVRSQEPGESKAQEQVENLHCGGQVICHANLGKISVIIHANKLPLLSQRVFFVLDRDWERGSCLLGLHEEENGQVQEETKQNEKERKKKSKRNSKNSKKTPKNDFNKWFQAMGIKSLKHLRDYMEWMIRGMGRRKKIEKKKKKNFIQKMKWNQTKSKRKERGMEEKKKKSK